MTTPHPSLAARHLSAFVEGATEMRRWLEVCESWGARLADALGAGARLLAAGNGGSAAEAQHLTSELVGRYRRDRRPLSALCLHAESSSVTAIVNDYGADHVFARQVLAHGRPGDVLVTLSTSGRSANLLGAVDAARTAGMASWALTGPAPNPLADAVDEALVIGARDAAVVQELHLVAVHLVCEAVDERLARMAGRGATDGAHRSTLAGSLP